MSDDEGEEEADSAEQVPEAGKDVSLIIGLLEEEDDNKKYVALYLAAQLTHEAAFTGEVRSKVSSAVYAAAAPFLRRLLLPLLMPKSVAAVRDRNKLSGLLQGVALAIRVLGALIRGCPDVAREPELHELLPGLCRLLRRAGVAGACYIRDKSILSEVNVAVLDDTAHLVSCLVLASKVADVDHAERLLRSKAATSLSMYMQKALAFAEAEAGEAVMDAIWFACWVVASGESDFYCLVLPSEIGSLASLERSAASASAHGTGARADVLGDTPAAPHGSAESEASGARRTRASMTRKDYVAAAVHEIGSALAATAAFASLDAASVAPAVTFVYGVAAAETSPDRRDRMVSWTRAELDHLQWLALDTVAALVWLTSRGAQLPVWCVNAFAPCFNLEGPMWAQHPSGARAGLWHRDALTAATRVMASQAPLPAAALSAAASLMQVIAQVHSPYALFRPPPPDTPLVRVDPMAASEPIRSLARRAHIEVTSHLQAIVNLMRWPDHRAAAFDTCTSNAFIELLCLQQKIADMIACGVHIFVEDIADITSKTMTDTVTEEGFHTFLAWVQTSEIMEAVSMDVIATVEATLQFLAFIVGDTSEGEDAAPEPAAIPKGFRSELIPGGGAAAGAAAPAGADTKRGNSADAERDVAGVSAQLARTDLSAGAHAAQLQAHSVVGRNAEHTGAARSAISGTSRERGSYAAGMASPAVQQHAQIRTDEQLIVEVVHLCVTLVCVWIAAASGPLEQDFLALLPKLCDWAAGGPQEPPPVPALAYEKSRVWDHIDNPDTHGSLREVVLTDLRVLLHRKLTTIAGEERARWLRASQRGIVCSVLVQTMIQSACTEARCLPVNGDAWRAFTGSQMFECAVVLTNLIYGLSPEEHADLQRRLHAQTVTGGPKHEWLDERGLDLPHFSAGLHGCARVLVGVQQTLMKSPTPRELMVSEGEDKASICAELMGGLSRPLVQHLWLLDSGKVKAGHALLCVETVLEGVRFCVALLLSCISAGKGATMASNIEELMSLQPGRGWWKAGRVKEIVLRTRTLQEKRAILDENYQNLMHVLQPLTGAMRVLPEVAAHVREHTWLGSLLGKRDFKFIASLNLSGQLASLARQLRDVAMVGTPGAGKAAGAAGATSAGK